MLPLYWKSGLVVFDSPLPNTTSALISQPYIHKKESRKATNNADLPRYFTYMYVEGEKNTTGNCERMHLPEDA